MEFSWLVIIIIIIILRIYLFKIYKNHFTTYTFHINLHGV